MTSVLHIGGVHGNASMFIQTETMFPNNQTRLTMWERVLKLYCDMVIHTNTKKRAMDILKELSLDLDTDPRLWFENKGKEMLKMYRELWWSVLQPDNNHTDCLQSSVRNIMSVEKKFPAKVIFSWKSLRHAISHYPPHFISFVAEHIDRSETCSDVMERSILYAAIESNLVNVVYRNMFVPLEITTNVVRDMCSHYEWETYLGMVTDMYIDKYKHAMDSLIASVLDVTLEQLSFFVEKIHAVHWCQFDNLIPRTYSARKTLGMRNTNISRAISVLTSNVMKHTGTSDGCETALTSGDEPVSLGRKTAIKDCIRQNDYNVLRFLLHPPGKSGLKPANEVYSGIDVSEFITTAIQCNAHECIRTVLVEFPEFNIGKPEANALLFAKRSTQIMCFDEDIATTYLFAMHVSMEKLTRQIDNLASRPPKEERSVSGMLVFLCGILAKKMEIDGHWREDVSIHTLFLKLFTHNTLADKLASILVHLCTARCVIHFACSPVPIAKHIYEKHGIEIPMHMWITSKYDIVPMYLCAKKIASSGKITSKFDDMCKRDKHMKDVNDGDTKCTDISDVKTSNKKRKVKYFDSICIKDRAVSDMFNFVDHASEALQRENSSRIVCLWYIHNERPTKRCVFTFGKLYNITVFGINVVPNRPEQTFPVLFECKNAVYLTSCANTDEKGVYNMKVTFKCRRTNRFVSLKQTCNVDDAEEQTASGIENNICEWVGSIPTKGNMTVRISTFVSDTSICENIEGMLKQKKLRDSVNIHTEEIKELCFTRIFAN